MLESAKRLLVCLHYGIGDVIMQLPVLDALKAFIPRASITLLGARPAIELLDDDRFWSSVRSIQEWGLRHWGDEGDEHIRTAIEEWIEDRRFDLILDVSHAVEAFKEVFWRRNRPILDTGGYLPTRGRNGAAAIQESVQAHWGLPMPAPKPPRIALQPHRTQFADAFLRRQGWNGRPPIGVSALASSRLKRWPPERLAEVADALSARYGLPVLMFAGPQPQIAAKLAADMQNLSGLMKAGTMHLLDTAALLSRCAILICNDTGLMHMGAAVGIPVVAVFGPTAEAIYLPPLPNSIGLSSTVPCPHRKTETFGPSPCLVVNRCLLDRNGCIDTIPAQDVLRAAGNVLSTELANRRRPKEMPLR